MNQSELNSVPDLRQLNLQLGSGNALGQPRPIKNATIPKDPAFRFECPVGDEPAEEVIFSPADLKLTGLDKARVNSVVDTILQQLPELVVSESILTLIDPNDLLKQAGDIIISDEGNEETGIGTLDDPRLGTISAEKKCATCRQLTSCPGHTGAIILPEPRLNPLYVRHIIRVLNSVCGTCGILKLSEQQLKDEGILNLKGFARLAKIEEKSMKVDCFAQDGKKRKDLPPGVTLEQCKQRLKYHTQASVNEKKILFTTNGNGQEPRELPPREVLKILNNIPEEDIRLLGFSEFSKPSNMVLQVLAVMPICSRPPVEVDGKRYDNDFTKTYHDILKNIGTIKKLRSTGKPNIMEVNRTLTTLDENIRKLIDGSDRKGLAKRSTNDVRSFLQGKAGALRRLLMGKRTD